MKVYLAMATIDYEDSWVEGVFSDRETAEQYTKKHHSEYADNRWVDDWDLDEPLLDGKR